MTLLHLLLLILLIVVIVSLPGVGHWHNRGYMPSGILGVVLIVVVVLLLLGRF